MVFLCSGFRSSLSHFLCFISVCEYSCMFHCDEVEDPFMPLWAKHNCYNVICSCIRIKGEVSFK